MLPIDRTLSPLDKLASQTQQLTSTTQQQHPQQQQQHPHQQQQHPQQQKQQPKHNNLAINTVLSSSFNQQPNQFSLTPLHTQSQIITQSPISIQQQQQQQPLNSNPINNNRAFNSALSQLTDSLNQLDHQLLFNPRRPSTGRVNSNTATTQTPREHIPSYYGDQHSIHSLDSSDHQQLPTSYPSQNQHDQDQHSQEVLNSSPSQHNNHQRAHQHDPHQTWTSFSTSETDSELDAQSSHYPSGLSLASEDPFQYRHYEASRQSRQPLQPVSPHLPASAQGTLILPTEIDPTTLPNRRQTNFSRPIQQSSGTSQPPLSSTSPQMESPPRDHRPTTAYSSNRDSESQYSTNLNYPIDTRVNSINSRKHQIDSSSYKQPNSNPSSLRSLGHAARSSIRSRSSIDTTSSTSSRLSWKRLFDFGSNSNQRTVNQDHNPVPAPNSDPTLPSNNLPEIVFSQSDHGRNTHDYRGDYSSTNNQDMSNYHHHKLNTHHHHQMGEPRVEVRSLHQTVYHQSSQEEGLSPSHNRNPQAKRTHRLSIYSLPSSDDLPPAELDQKQRYISRSPIAFDSSSSSQVPSPISDEADSQTHHDQPSNRPPQPRPISTVHYGNSNGIQLHSAIQKAKATLAVNHHQSSKGFKISQGQTAQDYLQAGIEAHERGDLERSAGLFERAAREGGGCGAGMLMWGLSLRHGWGCQVNEVRAFKWLQKAAESVIEDLDPNKSKSKSLHPPSSTSLAPIPPSSKNNSSSTTTGDKDQVAKSELILAIYELGQCFMRGWGCKKDKQLAISYFELAAKLGDPDAQQELGFCYTNGKGTKKDLKLAAKYYRMAAQQGVEMMGTQWIWKEKYN